MNDRSRMQGSKPLPAEDAYCVLVSIRVRPEQFRALERAAKNQDTKPAVLGRELIGKGLELTGQDDGAWSTRKESGA